jgi:hypothetical protein
MEENKDGLKTIHTLETDALEAIEKENITRSKIIAAEQYNKPIPEPEDRSSLSFNFRAVVIGLIFILITGFTIYYFANKESDIVVIPPPALTPEQQIMTYDNIVPVNITHWDKNVFVNQINELRNSNSNQGVTVYSFKISAEDLLNIINPTAPGIFIRSFEPIFILGQTTTGSFLILKPSSYEGSRGGLLEEEVIISRDIETLLKGEAKGVKIIDKIIDNKDVRTLQNETNETVLLYSFLDINTLVFAENDDTFRTIINRINSSRR